MGTTLPAPSSSPRDQCLNTERALGVRTMIAIQHLDGCVAHEEGGPVVSVP
jgi:hypothetical protein